MSTKNALSSWNCPMPWPQAFELSCHFLGPHRGKNPPMRTSHWCEVKSESETTAVLLLGWSLASLGLSFLSCGIKVHPLPTSRSWGKAGAHLFDLEHLCHLLCHSVGRLRA